MRKRIMVTVMALILFFTMLTGCGKASKEDYWKDENLEAAMREVTGIVDRDILLSDISALSGLTMLE